MCCVLHNFKLGNSSWNWIIFKAHNFFFDKIIDKLTSRRNYIIYIIRPENSITTCPQHETCARICRPDRSTPSSWLTEYRERREADKVSHRTSFYRDSIESESCNACWFDLHLLSQLWASTLGRCVAHNWMHFLILHKWEREKITSFFFLLLSSARLICFARDRTRFERVWWLASIVTHSRANFFFFASHKKSLTFFDSVFFLLVQL